MLRNRCEKAVRPWRASNMLPAYSSVVTLSTDRVSRPHHFATRPFELAATLNSNHFFLETNMIDARMSCSPAYGAYASLGCCRDSLLHEWGLAVVRFINAKLLA